VLERRRFLRDAGFEELVREVEKRMQLAVDQRARLELLLDAVVTMAADITLDGVLLRIVEVASRLVDAQYAALGVLNLGEGDRLQTFIYHGIGPESAAEIGELPTGHGLLGLIIDQPRPLRLHDIAEHPESYGFPAHHPPMHSFLGVPVRIRGQVWGNLYLTEKEDGSDFTPDDEEIVVALAAAAGVMIENARARDDKQRIALLEDRDRIARDLHDLVIQRLFAVGLSVQSASRRVENPGAAERLDRAVTDIDATIKDIRRTIFALGATESSADIQAEVTRVVDRAASMMKVRPKLELDGPIRTLVSPELAPDLLAVLSEALANAGRHADAESVVVRLWAGDEIVLSVADDGRGMIVGTAIESGLANMRRRAEDRGGEFTIESTLGEGTTVRWAVPRC
jgi:signal transduction histidine kinase